MRTAPVLAGTAVVVLFVGFLLAATDAHFVPQVLDLYVVCQYAKAMAEGHPFQYNPGEPPSTGSTSVLHTAILAGAWRLGARGEALVAFATLLGAALFLASIVVARRVAVRLGGPREGFLAGGLVALGGPVVWGFLYGSDIALYMFLSLWLLDRWLAWWEGGSAAGLAAAGALVALARPEGLLVALAIGGASFLTPRPPSPRERLLIWIPAAAGLLLLVVLRLVTGEWIGSSVAGKSLLPNYGVADSVGLAAEYGVDVVRGLLLGLYPSIAPIGFSRGWAPFVFPPLALLLVALALVRPPHALARPLRLWAALVALLFALVGPNVFMGVHFNRYLMWAFPALLALTATGLGVLARLVARDDAALDRDLFAAGALLFLFLGLLSTLRFADLFGQMAGEIYRREVPAAEWIRTNLPPGVAIANVATSVEYLTGHRNVNLHGVTTPAFFGTLTMEKEAGYFEALTRLPPAELPPYLLTSVALQESSPLLRELVSGDPLYRTFSLGDDLLVFRSRWDLVGKGRQPYDPETLRTVAGLAEVDRLNVGDVRDEAAHRYRCESRRGDLLLFGTVRMDTYEQPDGPGVVADAGRPVLDRETFRVRTSPGRDLVVVFRTHGEVEARTTRPSAAGQGPQGHMIEIPQPGFVVNVDGKALPRFAWVNKHGWNEHVFRVPGSALANGETELTLSGRYASFQYWFYQ
jgi:hypothetical protein